MHRYGKVYLDTFENFPQLRMWRNDERIHSFCRQNKFITQDDQEEWFAKQRKDPSIRMFCVKTCMSGQLVGVAGLTSIDYINSRAEFSLYIGPEHQRKGYAEDALKCLFTDGFRTLNLHQIWGETFDGNVALKLFEKLGMKVDGIRRDFYYKNGRYLNCTLVSILRDEWKL